MTAAQANVTVGANISGLTCGMTYHYRVDATNSQGTSLGNDLSFATAPCSATPPSATTTAAAAIFATTATLNGIVSSNGATTTVKFQYGTTTSYTGSGSPAACDACLSQQRRQQCTGLARAVRPGLRDDLSFPRHDEQ